MTTTKKSIASEVANEVAANKSVLAQNIEAIKNAVTTEFCESDGRVKKSFIFEAQVVESSDRNFFGGADRNFRYEITSTKNPQGFKAMLERLGYEAAIVFGQVPPKKVSLFKYTREISDKTGELQNRFEPVANVNHWKTAIADLSDADREVIRELYDPQESRDLLKTWNAKHPRNAEKPAQAPARMDGFTI